MDEASIFLEALRSLDLMHLIALRRLGELTQLQSPRNWLQDISATLDVHDEAVTVGIAAGLQRAGAIQLDPPGFGGYYLTPLGQRLLEYISPGS